MLVFQYHLKNDRFLIFKLFNLTSKFMEPYIKNFQHSKNI